MLSQMAEVLLKELQNDKDEDRMVKVDHNEMAKRIGYPKTKGMVDYLLEELNMSKKIDRFSRTRLKVL